MERIIRTKVKDLLRMEPGQDVLAKGWVRTKRGNNALKCKSPPGHTMILM